MNKKFLIAIVLFILTAGLVGCMNDPQSTQYTSNGIQVERLFENNGCTIYRFYDSRFVYYADCRSKATDEGTVTTSYTEHCGKGCARAVMQVTQIEP